MPKLSANFGGPEVNQARSSQINNGPGCNKALVTQNYFQICMTNKPEIGTKFLKSIYGDGFQQVVHGPKLHHSRMYQQDCTMLLSAELKQLAHCF